LEKEKRNSGVSWASRLGHAKKTRPGYLGFAKDFGRKPREREGISFPNFPVSIQKNSIRIQTVFYTDSKTKALNSTKIMHGSMNATTSWYLKVLNFSQIQNSRAWHEAYWYVQQVEGSRGACTWDLPCALHYVALPSVFDNFKINYNGNDKKWSLAKFIAKYRQEEERLRAEHKDFVNLISQDFNRNHGHSKSRWKFSHQKKGKGKSVMRTPRKKLLKSPRARVLSDAIVMIGGT
jgi:hypothetical protein